MSNYFALRKARMLLTLESMNALRQRRAKDVRSLLMSENRRARSLIGRHVGRLVLRRIIGEGGVCSVYEAEDTRDTTRFAVKVLFDLSADKLDRFRREARATWHLKHPNVVKSFAGGMVPGKFAFIVMELCAGRTLFDAIHSRERFSAARAARTLRDLALGVAAMHDAGYIHRDLKPGNIMLSGDGVNEKAKIIDLGIVSIPGLGTRDPAPDSTTAIVGTPTYMAPELMENALVTPSVDVYALGVILYEMLAGHPPFEGTLLEILAQQMTRPPPPLAHHGGLGVLALHLLAKDPSRRPACARELAEILAC